MREQTPEYLTRFAFTTYNCRVNKALEVILKSIDEKRAHEFVSEISRFHRMRGSREYDQALEFIKARLDQAGVANRVLEFPLDGQTRYWTWEMPKAWQAQRAVLRLPNGQVICDYQETRMCLVPGSSSVKGEFQIVDVGQGDRAEDYAGKDVEGKIVLSTGYPTVVNYFAVAQNRAAGVIFHYIPSPDPKIDRSSEALADAVFYPGVYPNFGVNSFAFSVSYNQFKRLRQIAKKGLRLHVEIEAENFNGVGKVLIAQIPGETPEGMVVISHLCHPSPGANDNASGSGLNLEMAVALAQMLKQGIIEQPYKSIYFVWVPEMYGTVAMIHNDPTITARLFTGFNLDMVGEDQALTKGPMIVETSPWSTPCFLGNLVNAVLDDIREIGSFDLPEDWSVKVQQFQGGSDHYILSDPTISIPTTMLGHWPDRFYHSSFDTPDKVSPETLKLVGAAAAASAWLTCWEHDQLGWVMKALVESAEQEIQAEKEKGATQERLSLLWAVRREGALAYAITRQEPYQVVADVDAGFSRIMQDHGIKELFFTVGGPVYARKFKAPLYIRSLLHIEFERYIEVIRSMRAHKNYIQGLTELVFLINGRRSHNEIFEFLRWEYPEVADIDYSDFLLMLKEADLLE